MSATTELGVYGSFLKDGVYATAMLFLFWVIRFPTYWIFLLHAVTWPAVFLYYSSDASSFWLPAIAITLTLFVGCVDAFLVAVTACYIPGNACCLPGRTAAPFTLGVQVCGPNDRYDPETLVWFVVSTVALGVLTSVTRAAGMWVTRDGTSLELPLSVLYVALKAYVLGWSHVTYSTLFWVQSMATMVAHVVATATPLRFVSFLIFLVVLGADLLVVLGATRAVSYFDGEPAAGGRRRLQSSWLTPAGGPVPKAVRVVWLVVHGVLISISFFNATSALTRPLRRKIKAEDDMRTEADSPVAAARYAGPEYLVQRKAYAQ
jgi:hypothetical protein